MTRTVLVVDDEPKILQVVRDYLVDAGFTVTTASDGTTALAQARAVAPDLVVLDLGLPGLDGLDVARELQRRGPVPIIMLTARSDEVDRVLGLELGADDYLVKPFSPRELVARVRAVLRRTERAAAGLADGDSRGPVTVGDVAVDPERRRVTVGGRPVELTATEFELVEHLARQPGRVFTRSQLLDVIHGLAVESYERAIDAHVKNIRRKLEPDPHRPRYLLTVHGVGYRFADGRVRGGGLGPGPGPSAVVAGGRGVAAAGRAAVAPWRPATSAAGSCWWPSGSSPCWSAWASALGAALDGWHWTGRQPRPGRARGRRRVAGEGWPLVDRRLRPGRRRDCDQAGLPPAGRPGGRAAGRGRAPRAGRLRRAGDARPGPGSCGRWPTTINEVAVRLAAAEEQRRRFLADVTHELRTPLAVLQSGIEAQIDGIHPRDDAPPGLAAGGDPGAGPAGRRPPHPGPGRRRPPDAAPRADPPVGPGGGRGRGPRRPRRPQGGAAGCRSVADGLPELDVDPTRIGQVLANLLSNAVRHTPAGGEVTVAVAAAPDGRVALRPWSTPAPASPPTSSRPSSSASPGRPTPGAAAWACPSPATSSSPTAGRCGPPTVPRVGPTIGFTVPVERGTGMSPGADEFDATTFDDREVAAVFGRTADRYDSVIPFFTSFGALLVEAAALEPGQRVLDMGCGRGATLLPASVAVGPMGRVVGIDLAEEMVALLGADLEAAGVENATVRVGNAQALDMEHGHLRRRPVADGPAPAARPARGRDRRPSGCSCPGAGA